MDMMHAVGSGAAQMFCAYNVTKSMTTPVSGNARRGGILTGKHLFFVVVEVIVVLDPIVLMLMEDIFLITDRHTSVRYFQFLQGG